ncbi:Rossmann-like and DUF2520 domain-containing protein [Salinimicrobium xinjiangense]|uniref:Rossmann-like and DUF2520 domain-containing protein n=1 Tax=Salinimicrobium xinjiangense TaxID=438596 RepID=UPI000412E448|nr:DUF2520 domain-containing protein [Salinimicrobium xinjiangense]
MIEIVVLGSGNVATHLFKAFSASEGIRIKQVYNHSEASLDFFENKVEITTDFSEIAEADVYILALKDDVIPQTAEKLKDRSGLVVHTSGSVALDALSGCSRRGVFYPLQTFSKDNELNYSEIPFCLEANSEEDLQLLKKIADRISGKAYDISSEQRKKLHLSAVFVCNFVNHLYAVGEQICQKSEIPFDILKPLIKETASKVQHASPAGVQTGPAIRNDQSTINTHLDLLESSENRKIYELLTSAIQTFHGKKL